MEYLSNSRRNLRVFSNEDAMVGMWLLSINRELVDIGGKFYCDCHYKPKQLDPEPFYVITLSYPYFPILSRPGHKLVSVT